MTPLEAQKRLLIAESELNRANLAEGLAGLGSGVAAMVAGATRVETLCSSLVTVITGGRLFASLWKTFRS
jgi:hypothetical protein